MSKSSGHFSFLLRAAIASGVSSAVVAFASLIKGKANAYFLGVDGVGTVAQVLGFQSIMGSLAGLGLSFAVIKYSAKYKALDDYHRLRIVVWLPVIISLFISFVITVATWFFADIISEGLFADSSLGLLVVCGVMAVPFSAASAIFIAVITGYRDNRTYVIVSIASSLISIPIVVGMVWHWGVLGSVLATLFVSILQVIFAVYFLRKRDPRLFYIKINVLTRNEVLSIFRGMLFLGVLQLFGGINANFIKLSLRTNTVHFLGVEANGLYQGIIPFSNQLVALALGFLNLYLFPKVSELRDPEEVNTVTSDSVRFTVVIMTSIATGLLLFREPIIRLLLTDSFLPAVSLMPAQTLGDIIYVLGTAILIGSLSVGPQYLFSLLGMFFYWMQIPAFFLLRPLIGVSALPYSYLIGAIIYFLACLLVMNRLSRFRLSGSNAWLMFRSGLLIFFAIKFANSSWLVTLIVVLAGFLWIISIPSAQEWQKIKKRMFAHMR